MGLKPGAAACWPQAGGVDFFEKCWTILMLYYIYNIKMKRTVSLERMSRLRKKANDLGNESSQLMQTFTQRAALIKGTVYERKTKCGKDTCKCTTEGKLHVSLAHSWSQEGRTRLRTVDQGHVERLREAVALYQDFRKLKRRYVKLQHEILEVIDGMEKERTVEP